MLRAPVLTAGPPACQAEPVFKVELLEYCDAAGVFHEKEWDPAACFIERSKRFDPRNGDGRLNYTSIILDAWKR